MGFKCRPFSLTSSPSKTSPRESLPSSRRSSDDDLSTSEYYLGPFISDIYSQAFQFKQVLNADDPSCVKSLEISSPESPRPVEESTAFVDLVGRDLNASEQAAAAPFSKLRVSSDTWLDAELTDEPSTYSGPTESPLASPPSTSSNLPVLEPEIRRVNTVAEKEPWHLEPQEVTKLLIEGFGSLAREGEEEQLIFESEGGVSQDVTIVGVIHLTTHRIAFHASLLTPESENSVSHNVIKAGPVVIHRKGLRKKRRVWMELTSEMLCTYASSKHEDKIRPLRSIFLSSIREVKQRDPNNPRFTQVVFDKYLSQSSMLGITGLAEFDTEESANDWRRELTGAIFLYKHRRQKALRRGADNKGEEPGIRLSIPLERILKVEYGLNACMPHMALCHIETDDPRSPSVLNQQVHRKVMLMQIGTATVFDKWLDLPKFVDAARAGMNHSHSDLPLIIDTGPLFPEVHFSDGETPADKEESIRLALGIAPNEAIWSTKAYTAHAIACPGHLVVSDRCVGFWSNYIGQTQPYRIPFSDVRIAKPHHSRILRVYALILELRGHEDVRFDFGTAKKRDEAVQRVNTIVNSLQREEEKSHYSSDSMSRYSLDTGSDSGVSLSPKHVRPHAPTLTRSMTSMFSPLSRTFAAAIGSGLPSNVYNSLPRKVINLPREMLIHRPPLKFACLTIGSRGDVQPYIALGLGLKKEGHHVVIVTHDEYKEWIEGFGLEHRQAGGDPGALMKLSVENKMFSPDFFKESLRNFRPWLDQLLLDAWESCKDADVLLESPSAMAGVHIAEALNIPYFRTFTMPWTKTSEFPHAFISPPVEAPAFNSTTYILFENVMWAATSGQINKWRQNTLHLPNTDMGHLAQSKITFIYNFSQAVVPKPLDWGDTTIISGYWFLDNPDLNWTPPGTLLDFMDKARKDHKPIVYIGFGSITIPHPNRVTAKIMQGVLKSGCRAIISKGWSSRMSKDEKDPEPDIPPECYLLDKVPHDWLFPKIDAAFHHGGAGTTGASLRAGIPTIIKPWFGDQFFWASRVQKLGAGLKVSTLRENEIAEALISATSSRLMKEKAAHVGERIRQVRIHYSLLLHALTR
jgi:sterol 3beta-glucosyltransferase